MNIFFLDRDIETSVRYHCDKHVVKMLLEATQMLSTAHNTYPRKHIPGLYALSHTNHPMCMWVRERIANYRHCVDYANYLLVEYKWRYKKRHQCQYLLDHLSHNYPAIPFEMGDRSVLDTSRPPLCMPEEFKGVDVIQSYRAYYRSKQTKFTFRYTNREAPPWLT